MEPTSQTNISQKVTQNNTEQIIVQNQNPQDTGPANSKLQVFLEKYKINNVRTIRFWAFWIIVCLVIVESIILGLISIFSKRQLKKQQEKKEQEFITEQKKYLLQLSENLQTLENWKFFREELSLSIETDRMRIVNSRHFSTDPEMELLKEFKFSFFMNLITINRCNDDLENMMNHIRNTRDSWDENENRLQYLEINKKLSEIHGEFFKSKEEMLHMFYLKKQFISKMKKSVEILLEKNKNLLPNEKNSDLPNWYPILEKIMKGQLESEEFQLAKKNLCNMFEIWKINVKSILQKIKDINPLSEKIQLPPLKKYTPIERVIDSAEKLYLFFIDTGYLTQNSLPLMQCVLFSKKEFIPKKILQNIKEQSSWIKNISDFVVKNNMKLPHHIIERLNIMQEMMDKLCEYQLKYFKEQWRYMRHDEENKKTPYLLQSNSQTVKAFEKIQYRNLHPSLVEKNI